MADKLGIWNVELRISKGKKQKAKKCGRNDAKIEDRM